MSARDKPPALPAEFFVSGSLEAKPVALEDGTEHTLWFRQVSAMEYRRFQLAEHSDDDDVRAGSMARLIAASLCNPDGTPALTLERAAQLKPRAAGALLTAVLEVNGLASRKAGEQGNAHPPGAGTSGSGTSSLSHSEGEASSSGSA